MTFPVIPHYLCIFANREQQLLEQGIWFSENDILHVVRIIWTLYLPIFLIKRAKYGQIHWVTSGLQVTYGGDLDFQHRYILLVNYYTTLNGFLIAFCFQSQSLIFPSG